MEWRENEGNPQIRDGGSFEEFLRKNKTKQNKTKQKNPASGLVPG